MKFLKGEIQSLLKKHGLRPSKFRGQHFLIDSGVLGEIVKIAGLKPPDTVLEIGAGIGNLTKELLATGARVIAVEKDLELARVLGKIFSGKKNLTIAAGDILDFNETKINREYKVVGNIPYYITGPIIRKFLASKNQPYCLVLTVQKEVGKRMIAQPPQATFLSMMVSVLASVSIKVRVKAGSFWPAPKVDSVVVLIRPTAAIEPDKKRLIELIRLGFRQPRKTLVRNLVEAKIASRETILTKLKSLGLAEKVRAHEVSQETWQKLYRTFVFNG